MSATDGSEMDGYEALVSELRANPPVAPERLRQRVLEGAPATRAPRSRKRRLVLVVVPAAVVLAVGAALVHGFVSSGSKNQTYAALAPSLRQSPRVSHQAEKQLLGPGTTTPAAATADRELAPLTKSKSSQSYYLDQNTAVASGSVAGGDRCLRPKARSPSRRTGSCMPSPRSRSA